MVAKKPKFIYCPFCNAKGSKQPVLSPMNYRFTPNDPPKHLYKCARCGYVELFSEVQTEPLT